ALSRSVAPVPSGAPSSSVPVVGAAESSAVALSTCVTAAAGVSDVLVPSCANATCAFNAIRNGAATAAATGALNQYLRIGLLSFLSCSPLLGAQVHQRFF